MIGNYVSAAQLLVRRGYHIIPMGAIVEECLPVSHPMIIDYATNGMRDFMDIYLSATLISSLPRGEHRCGHHDIPLTICIRKPGSIGKCTHLGFKTCFYCEKALDY